MDRKLELEKIIIGSLLNDFNEYYPSCRCTITSSMFTDDFLSKVYSTLVKMEQEHIEVNICTLVDYPGTEYNSEQMLFLCDLAKDYNFLIKKYYYNRKVFLYDNSKYPRYTHVTFDDYVNKFIQMCFKKAV